MAASIHAVVADFRVVFQLINIHENIIVHLSLSSFKYEYRDLYFFIAKLIRLGTQWMFNSGRYVIERITLLSTL